MPRRAPDAVRRLPDVRGRQARRAAGPGARVLDPGAPGHEDRHRSARGPRGAAPPAPAHPPQSPDGVPGLRADRRLPPAGPRLRVRWRRGPAAVRAGAAPARRGVAADRPRPGEVHPVRQVRAPVRRGPGRRGDRRGRARSRSPRRHLAGRPARLRVLRSVRRRLPGGRAGHPAVCLRAPGVAAHRGDHHVLLLLVRLRAHRDRRRHSAGRRLGRPGEPPEPRQALRQGALRLGRAAPPRPPDAAAGAAGRSSRRSELGRGARRGRGGVRRGAEARRGDRGGRFDAVDHRGCVPAAALRPGDPRQPARVGRHRPGRRGARRRHGRGPRRAAFHGDDRRSRDRRRRPRAARRPRPHPSARQDRAGDRGAARRERAARPSVSRHALDAGGAASAARAGGRGGALVERPRRAAPPTRRRRGRGRAAGRLRGVASRSRRLRAGPWPQR